MLKLKKQVFAWSNNITSILSERKNMFFLDFPVTNKKLDYIGFDSFVESLFRNIKDKARIIGLVAEYGSGKSSVISLLKNRLSLHPCYKIVTINLWGGTQREEPLLIHKKFIYQLSSQLNKYNPSYIHKKFNSNYGSINFVSKSKTNKFLWFLAAIFFIISILNRTDMLHYINFVQSLNLNSDIYNFLKQITDISGFISIVIVACIAISSEILFSFFRGEKQRVIDENESVDTYMEIIRANTKKRVSNFFLGKNIIIVIEDLDRMNGKSAEHFLKQIYTFYANSLNSNVTFIVAIKPKDYLKNKEEYYKIFDYTVDLQKIKYEFYGNILKQILKEKKSVLMSKYNYDILENIGIWNWISRGDQVNIRRIKHRYNDTILIYSSLHERFKGKSISIESCIAASYLKDEYPQYFQKLIEEKRNDNVFYSDINTLYTRFIKNRDINVEEIWKDVANDYNKTKENESNKNILERFKKDVFNLILNEFINFNYELYFYSYPINSVVMKIEESNVYRALIYDDKVDKISNDIENVIKENTAIIDNALEYLKNIEVKLPENIFNNELLFNYIYEKSTVEEKSFIFKNMLKLNKSTAESSLAKLEQISKYDLFTSELIEKYIDEIIDDFSKSENEEFVTKTRRKLAVFFKDNLKSLSKLYIDGFPFITSNEIQDVGDLSIIPCIINYSKLDENNIKYLLEFINKKYNNSLDVILEILSKIDARYILDAFYELNVYDKLDETDKLIIKNLVFSKIDISTPTEIMKFSSKITILYEEFSEKLISEVENGNLDSKEYCCFLNGLMKIDDKTLEFISSNEKINFAFNEKILLEMLNKKYYLGFIKSNILSENKFEIDFVNEIKYRDDYIKFFKMHDRYDLYNETTKFSEYIQQSVTALKYYKDLKIYADKSLELTSLLMFSKLKQDMRLFAVVFKPGRPIDFLEKYLFNITDIKIGDNEQKLFVENNMETFLNVSKAAFDNFFNIASQNRELKKLKKSLITKRNWVKRRNPIF